MGRCGGGPRPEPHYQPQARRSAGVHARDDRGALRNLLLTHRLFRVILRTRFEWQRGSGLTARIQQVTRATRVLVVDDLTETADVLRAVLEPRGMTVERAPRTGAHVHDPRAIPLALVVVDA